jgi:hypothetical protein
MDSSSWVKTIPSWIPDYLIWAKHEIAEMIDISIGFPVVLPVVLDC